MNRVIIRYALLLLFVSSLVSVAASQVPGPDSACTPKFPFLNGWLGSDVGSSVRLPDGRDFWIFGDTLFGEKRVVTGNDPTMVRNTVGVSTCKDGKFDIKYTIRKNANKEVDYFTARVPNTWYWALNGAYFKGDIWVTLLCVKAVPNDKSFALGFKGCGADLAHITGISDPDPQKWKIDYLELVPDGGESYPTAAVVFEKEYLYIFSINDFGDRSQVVTRVPVSKLKEPKKNLEYLAVDLRCALSSRREPCVLGGIWKPGFDAKNAQAVMAKGASEFTVRYHPELKKWIAVMFEPGWMTSKIILRSADDLLGPWTEGVQIYDVPEMHKENAGYDPDTFCYAAKEHPEFEKSGELVFTYVCNSMKPPKVVDLTNIYFPQVVRQPMPEVK
jgi:hypothetical protein